MQINTEARTDDVRALAVAMVLGSVVGLTAGGAYLAGSFARSAVASATNVGVASPALALLGSMSPRVRSSRAPSTGATAPDLSADAPAPHPSLVAVHDGAPLAGAGTGDRRCLAQAVYYEARGESPTGQAAVAQVVLNRVRLPRFPKSLCGVVYQRSGDACQFSFACNGAMRGVIDETAWRRAEDVAGRVLHGAGVAEVRGATMFQAVSAAGRGEFAGGLMQVAQIGAHVFYRLTSHGSGSRPATYPTHQNPAPAAFTSLQPTPVHVVFEGSAPVVQPPAAQQAAAVLSPVAEPKPTVLAPVPEASAAASTQTS